MNNPLEVIIVNGFTGVALFFMLSGFIFTIGALQSGKIQWRKFYRNRFLRIFPLFLLINLVALIFGSMPLRQLFFNLIGFGNYHLGYSIYDIVLWTISLEVQFYMLFPFLFDWLKKQGVKLLWSLLAIMIVIRLLARLDGAYLHDLVYWTMFGRLDQFLIGMIAAWYAHKYGWLNGKFKMRRDKLMWGLAISASAMIALQWVYTATGWKYGESYLQVVWPAIEALTWAVIAVCYVGLARNSKSVWLRFLQFIGIISFSLYILQYPIIKLLQQQGWVLDMPNRLVGGLIWTTFVALPLSIASAWISYRVIEKPPLELRKQYTKN